MQEKGKKAKSPARVERAVSIVSITLGVRKEGKKEMTSGI
jgi:hypothetical protein